MALENTPDYQEPPVARVEIKVNGRSFTVVERKPGNFTESDGSIKDETRVALQNFFEQHR